MSTSPIKWDPPPRRIAVLRALPLADLLCAVPALRALRAHCPDAHITLVALPEAAEFVERFPRYVDDLLPFPGAPGVAGPVPPPGALREFFAAARARAFDIALQMHGSNGRAHLVLSGLQARRSGGFHVLGARAPDDAAFLRWPTRGAEIHRCLALMCHLGVPDRGDGLEWPVAAADRLAAHGLLRDVGVDADNFVCLHPGARTASRRWPLERYVRVGEALAERAWRVVVTGTGADAAVCRVVATSIGPLAVDLSGRTTMPALAALLEASRLLVGNDTVVTQLAAALGTPSVTIACGTDVERWAALDRTRHPVLAAQMPCRPCAHASCPIGHPCASQVHVEAVLEACCSQLAQPLRRVA